MIKKCKSARCKKSSEFNRLGYCNNCFLTARNRAFIRKDCLRCKGSNDFQYFKKKNIGLEPHQFHPWKIRYLCSKCIRYEEDPTIHDINKIIDDLNEKERVKQDERLKRPILCYQADL